MSFPDEVLHDPARPDAAQPGALRRLVVVTHYFPAHHGGVEIVAGELARRLSATGRFAVQWYASDMDPPPKPQAGLDHVSVPSANFIERRLKLPYPLWSAAIIGSLWCAIRVANVVHLHDFIYCGNLVAFVMAKLQSKRVVVTQHVGSIPYANPLLRLLHRSINRVLGGLVLRHADRVIFISEVVLREFAQFVQFRRAPLLIWNGVDLSVYAPGSEQERAQLRAGLKLRPDMPTFLFVGRFIEKKGLSLMRTLATEFPGIQWLFAGAGSLNPEGWELQNVTVFRDRSGTSLADLYRAADLLVLPSKGEGLPLVVQESMACGTPVLIGAETAAAVPSLASCSFCEPVLTEDAIVRWKNRVLSLSREPWRLRSMRRDVAEFARERWSWELCAKQYEQVFAESFGQ